MGFFSSFLGHAAANAISEANRETKKHNDLCYQLSDYNAELDDYLKRVGCDAVYIADWSCLDGGSITIEKRKMDAIKRKMEEYIRLGGEPRYVHDLDELDDCIEKVKYLKSKGCLDRQKEFEHQELYWVKDDIEREEKEDREITLLLNAQGNELSSVVNQGEYSFVSYHDVNDPDETIWIDTAKSYNEYTVQFLEYRTVSLKFNKRGYYVYSYDDQKQLYFKSSIGENQRVEVSSLPIPAVQGWSMIVINGLELLCSTELADSVRDLYVEHNMSITEEENTLSALAAENINNLSGVEFERVCQLLVENMGFSVETTKASGDGGIDLIAYNSQPLLSGKYIIQCKRYTGSVGEPIIRDLYGVVMSERANKGILMTTGHVTKSAIAFAEGKPIELIDGAKMQSLFSQYGLMDAPNVKLANRNPQSYQSSIENVLGEKTREFFENKWEEFENCYYTFTACLDDLIETTNLKEKVNILDTVVSGMKLYEAYLMASRMPSSLQSKMFTKILGIMDIGKYESDEAETIYSALIVNEDGLRDNIRNTVLPTEDYSAGMFWTFLIAASDEMMDYDYIKDLQMYHMQYIIPLATCVQCFIDDDVLEELTMGYCGEIHNLLSLYLEGK